MQIQACKGTRDILPEDINTWHFVESSFSRTAELFGYREIRTPIFEMTDLFTRGIGETSEIVDKEMYTFPDKRGRSLTLRPEFTAPVVRAFIEHSYGTKGLAKLYYAGPIFRYENPQAGRYRQAHQFGIEAIGSASPELDVEVIALAIELFQSLGLKNLSVDINTIGCSACRPAYKSGLKEFFSARALDLCPDCVKRLERNPLRILDCKREGCRSLARGAPDIFPFLDDECRSHFDTVIGYLKEFEIPYTLNPFIVRGLDYYTRTVFEVLSGKLGAQNALCGGGRYDDLAAQLGGSQTPGVGFAVGIDRTVIVALEEGVPIPRGPSYDVFLVYMGDQARRAVVKLLLELRRKGLRAEMDYMMRGTKGQLRQADRAGAPLAVVIGDDELQSGQASLKDMKEGKQESVPFSRLAEILLERSRNKGA
jgi:histidyl-tRNA synthetase